MTFLDENTMLFGEPTAVKDGLDVRDGEQQGVASTPDMMQMIVDAESGPVWSVLDQQGTQNMLRSALGEAAALADYDTIKKRLLGSLLQPRPAAWRGFRSERADLGFVHGGHAFSPDEGGHAVQEGCRHRQWRRARWTAWKSIPTAAAWW